MDKHKKLAFDQLHEGVQILDRELQFLYVNNVTEKHGRKTLEELRGKKMIECFPDLEETEMYQLLLQTLEDGKHRKMENKFYYEDKSFKWFELHFEPHDEGILIRSFDISDRKRLESQYYHSQKLDALGQLSAEVAHDFNNKLAILALNCELLQREEQNQERINEIISHMKLAIEQSSAMTKRLLAFGRNSVIEPKICDLNKILEDNIESMSRLIGDKIKIEFSAEEKLGHIRIDHSQLDQIFMNLCVNSRDAMSHGGVITIRTQNVFLDQPYTMNHVQIESGDYVLISFSDNGTGIEEEHLERIFEPFYTTKEAGLGTGLGLATIHGIVKQAGGQIWVYSEVGVGTTFKIYFPMVRGDSKVAQIQRQTNERINSQEFKILIVDDNEFLRNAISEMLKGMGHQTLLAQNAKRAIELFSENKIDVLLSDINMPDMNGDELASILRDRDSKLKVILMTGYAGPKLDIGDNVAILEKPFFSRDIELALAKILN